MRKLPALLAPMVLALLAAPALAITDTVGYNDSTYQIAFVHLAFQGINASASGILQTIGINQESAYEKIIVGLYSTDENDLPYELLALSNVTAGVTGWLDVPVTGWNITSGTKYYLAVSVGNTTTSTGYSYYNSSEANWVRFKDWVYNGELPNLWGGDTGPALGTFNVRITYNETYNPPAFNIYKDYIVSMNCTVHSSAPSGSLVCDNAIPIPSDCANISSSAYTVIIPKYETGLNASRSFTRYTCNPKGDQTTYCDQLYRTCSYPNMNVYPSREWNNYAAGGTATSYHIAVIPDGCIVGAGANFTMIGRLTMSCKSPTTYGIIIDNETQNCTHTVVCFNSNTMEERFADCTSVLTPCPYGCVENVCIPSTVTTTTIIVSDDPFIAGTQTAVFGLAGMVGGMFGAGLDAGKFLLWTALTLGISGYAIIWTKAEWAFGGVVALILVGLGIAINFVPMWIGVAIIVLGAALIAKTFGLVGGG